VDAEHPRFDERWRTSEELHARITSDIATWAKVVKGADSRMDQ
jgi:hypothetical protein